MLKSAQVKAQSAPSGIHGMVRQYVPHAGHWDEALLESGFPRRHWRGLAVALGRMGFAAFSSNRWRNRAATDSGERRHLQRLRRSLRASGAAVVDGSDPAADRPRTSGLASSAPIAQRATLLNAGARAISTARRSWFTAATFPRAHAVRESELFAAVLRDQAAGRRLSSQLCRRYGAVSRWHLVGDRGPHTSRLPASATRSKIARPAHARCLWFSISARCGS